MARRVDYSKRHAFYVELNKLKQQDNPPILLAVTSVTIKYLFGVFLDSDKSITERCLHFEFYRASYESYRQNALSKVFQVLYNLLDNYDSTETLICRNIYIDGGKDQCWNGNATRIQ